MQLSDKVNLARKLDMERLDLNRQVADLETRIAVLKAEIKESLEASDQAEFHTNKAAWAKLNPKEVYNVKDWEKFYNFMVYCYGQEEENSRAVAFSMLQKRPVDSMIATFLEMHNKSMEEAGLEQSKFNVCKLGGKMLV